MRLENRQQIIHPAEHRLARYLLLGTILVVATVLAYIPSLGGGFIWDDPDYVVNNQTLRSLHGLWRMWNDIRSLPQWYPLVHTTFWLEYQLFGLEPLAYKLTNLTLHFATALMLWRLLFNLQVPGSYLAALVFALHPVHVESVAWITERKNALSGLFYVGAFLAYLKAAGFAARQQQPPIAPAGTESIRLNHRWYIVTLVLFACALLSKTVTASFPAAVLVVIWWKRGHITAAMVRPVVPMFIMGACMGLLTSWLERNHVGAVGVDWDYAPTWYGEFAARTLIAGRAVWFYLGKLVWPHPIAFMYDRWTIDPRDWVQWLYPIGIAALLLVLTLGCNRFGRAPIAAMLLFVGTLFPALGYFNVFPHRYSFVADHFQHLASIAITTLICAGVALALKQRRGLYIAAHAAVIVALGTLTFRQGNAYESQRTLWLDTAAKSPGSWVAYTNLGKIAADDGEMDRAMEYHEQALALAPDVADTWYNMAAVYATREQWAQATAAFNRVQELSTAKPWSGVNLDAIIGLARVATIHESNQAKAEQLYQQALSIRADYPPALYYYGRFLQREGRLGEAILKFAEYVDASPNDPVARAELGGALLAAGQATLAIEPLEAALRLGPARVDVLVNLGIAQMLTGQKSRAAMSFRRALTIEPNNQMARDGLAEATR